MLRCPPFLCHATLLLVWGCWHCSSSGTGAFWRGGNLHVNVHSPPLSMVRTDWMAKRPTLPFAVEALQLLPTLSRRSPCLTCNACMWPSSALPRAAAGRSAMVPVLNGAWDTAEETIQQLHDTSLPDISEGQHWHAAGHRNTTCHNCIFDTS